MLGIVGLLSGAALEIRRLRIGRGGRASRETQAQELRKALEVRDISCVMISRR
jgi:hypothetical protein